MEPAVNSAVPAVRLGQTTQRRGGWRVWLRNTLVLLVFLGFTGWFAAAAYGARHRPRELTYALLIYFLLVQLVFLVARFEKVRRDPAGNRRQIRVAVWLVSLTLANTTASCVVDSMPVAALRMMVWAASTVVTGIAFYYLFCSNDDGRCCDVEHGRGQAALSPEQKV